VALKRIVDKLATLGFTTNEAQIYIFLAKKGPCEAEKLAVALKLTQPELNYCLKSLKAKCIITSVNKRSPLFYAISFEKVLDLFMEGNIEQTIWLQENKKQLLTIWKSMLS
jgi:sugar-specific transcriptional regulator TrmB